MKIYGFKNSCLNLGQMEVNFSLENPLTSCSQCGIYVSRVMTTPVCKHIMCELCYVSVGEHMVLCKICGTAKKVLRRKTFDEEAISKYLVTCSCDKDFELRKIKSHLINHTECLSKNPRVAIKSEPSIVKVEPGEILAEEVPRKIQETPRDERYEAQQRGVHERLKRMEFKIGEANRRMKTFERKLINLSTRLSLVDDNYKIVIIYNIKEQLMKFRSNFEPLWHSSGLFVCGGVKWKMSLRLMIYDYQKEEHRVCIGSNGAPECNHFDIGIYWHPEDVDDVHDFYPIVKRLSYEVMNKEGWNIKCTMNTFFNGRFVNECFELFCGGACGHPSIMTLPQLNTILNGQRFDELKLKVRVTDI